MVVAVEHKMIGAVVGVGALVTEITKLLFPVILMLLLWGLVLPRHKLLAAQVISVQLL